MTTRVLLVGMPRMLRELVRDLVDDAGAVEIIGEASSDATAVAIARKEHVDVIVAGVESGGLPPEYDRLMAERPHLRVVAVASNGRHGTIHELRPHKQALGELGRETLLAAVCGPRAVPVPSSP